MIQIKNAHLTYPDGDSSVTALNDVSLTVDSGEYVAITGPSGSGKSSLLAAAATLVTPDSGEVWLDDIDVTQISRREAAALRRTKLGIVFQSPNLIPSLTVAEQLEIMLRVDSKRRDKKADRAVIREMLAEVDCENLAERLPSQLSGGQQQRVNIARAIIHSPSVLLVDEPTSALDQERGQAIIELLGRLTKLHRTATIVVTHEKELLPHFDSAYEMRDGVLTSEFARRAATV